jgi:hypothetical protein
VHISHCTAFLALSRKNNQLITFTIARLDWIVRVTCNVALNQTLGREIYFLQKIPSNNIDTDIDHHHHLSVMELGHLLTLSGLMYPEASSKVCHGFFCQLGSSVSLTDIDNIDIFINCNWVDTQWQ